MRMMFSSDTFMAYEEAWNAYPYCKTVVTVNDLNDFCPLIDRANLCLFFFFQSKRFTEEEAKVTVETLHLADRGTTENVCQSENILSMHYD